MRQYLVLLLLCAGGACAQTQTPSIPDTGRVIILSDRVGPDINPEERQKFGLFAPILMSLFGSPESYRNAVVVQLPDSTFRVRFTVGRQDDPPRDTLVTYSYEVLWRIAERIEHFEEIQSGAYKPGQRPPTLLSATGEPVLPSSSKQRATSTGRAALADRMKLPLAQAEGYPYPRYFPALDFGIGLRTYGPDLSGLSGVFGKTPSLGISPMVSGVAEIALSEMFAMQCEAALSIGGESAAQANLGGVYFISLVPSRTVKAFLGAAIVFFSMDSKASGLIVEAGGTGFSGTIGVQLQLGQSGAMDVYGGYCSLPDVATEFSEYKSPTQGTPPQEVKTPVSVKLSSPIFGLRFKFFE